jgi:O-antigen ligase
MRAAARALLVLFAFAIPWEYSLDFGEPVGNIARVAGLLVLLAAIPAILQAGRIRTPGALQWLVLAFYLWLCCTILWSVDRDATLDHLRGTFQVIMSVWLLWELVESPAELRLLLRAFVAGSWVLALLTLLNFASPESADQARFVAAGQDANDTARFLDLALPVAALLYGTERSWPARLLSLAYLPVGLLCVLLTASREGFLAALTALLGCIALLAGRSRKRTLVALTAAPVAIAAIWIIVPRATLERLATIPDQLLYGDLNQRLNIWTMGWQAFARAPFFGSGAGSYVAASGLASIDTAHNTVLSLGVEGGIVVLILSAAIVLVSVRNVWKMAGALRLSLGASFAVWCVSLVVATVEQNRSTWLLLGLLASAARLSMEAPEETALCFSAVSRSDAAPALADGTA